MAPRPLPATTADGVVMTALRRDTLPFVPDELKKTAAPLSKDPKDIPRYYKNEIKNGAAGEAEINNFISKTQYVPSKVWVIDACSHHGTYGCFALCHVLRLQVADIL